MFQIFYESQFFIDLPVKNMKKYFESRWLKYSGKNYLSFI